MEPPRDWRFTPQDTAVLLVDVQNEYFALDRGSSTPGLIANLRTLLECARAAGIPVLFSRLAFDDAWSGNLYPELRPIRNERVLLPHRISDLFQGHLGEALTRLGTRKLILAGIDANATVECTAASAKERGFEVTVVSDALGGLTPRAHAYAVTWSFPLLVDLVLQTSTLTSLLFAPALESVTSLTGAMVYSNCGGWIGTIRHVFFTGAGLLFLEAAPPRPSSKPVCVPERAVCKAGKNKVYLNMPGQLIDCVMPGWIAEFSRGSLERAA